jgi:uncharacterized protein (DUF302 family)
MAVKPIIEVIFGNPQTGAPTVEAAPLTRLDPPLKVPVWEGRNWTCVRHTAPREPAAQCHLTDELAAGVAGITALPAAEVAR